jgi:hypothetical protein
LDGEGSPFVVRNGKAGVIHVNGVEDLSMDFSEHEVGEENVKEGSQSTSLGHSGQQVED